MLHFITQRSGLVCVCCRTFVGLWGGGGGGRGKANAKAVISFTRMPPPLRSWDFPPWRHNGRFRQHRSTLRRTANGRELKSCASDGWDGEGE